MIYIRPCWIFHRVTVTKSWLWSVCAWTHIERFLFGHPFSEATERRGNPRPKLGDQCLGASACNRQCGAKMPAIDVVRKWLWRNRSAAANRLSRCNKFDRWKGPFVAQHSVVIEQRVCVTVVLTVPIHFFEWISWICSIWFAETLWKLFCIFPCGMIIKLKNISMTMFIGFLLINRLTRDPDWDFREIPSYLDLSSQSLVFKLFKLVFKLEWATIVISNCNTYKTHFRNDLENSNCFEPNLKSECKIIHTTRICPPLYNTRFQIKGIPIIIQNELKNNSCKKFELHKVI